MPPARSSPARSSGNYGKAMIDSKTKVKSSGKTKAPWPKQIPMTLPRSPSWPQKDRGRWKKLCGFLGDLQGQGLSTGGDHAYQDPRFNQTSLSARLLRPPVADNLARAAAHHSGTGDFGHARSAFAHQTGGGAERDPDNRSRLRQ